MYLLFKSVDDRKLGIIQKVGYWMDNAIGYLPDTHVDLVDWSHLNARVLKDSDVAYSYMFIGHSRGYLSVRSGTPQNERLKVLNSEEATGEKVQYDLDSADEDNCTALMKEIMRLQLDDVYDKKLTQKKIAVSSLEYNSWEEQRREALSYKADSSQDSSDLPLLGALASARSISLHDMAGKVNTAISNYDSDIRDLMCKKQTIETEIKACNDIADCNRVLHKRYNVTMPSYQAQSEGDSSSATYNL